MGRGIGLGLAAAGTAVGGYATHKLVGSLGDGAPSPGVVTAGAAGVAATTALLSAARGHGALAAGLLGVAGGAAVGGVLAARSGAGEVSGNSTPAPTPQHAPNPTPTPTPTPTPDAPAAPAAPDPAPTPAAAPEQHDDVTGGGPRAKDGRARQVKMPPIAKEHRHGIGRNKPDGLRGSKPNIVLYVTDDQSVDQIAHMPFVKHMPGARIDNAIIENPLCCPSRATILSGQFSPKTRVQWLNGDAFNDKQTLATWLKKAGYRTALVGKYLNEYPFHRRGYIPPGWTDWHAFHDKPTTGAAYYNYDLNDNGKIHTFKHRAKDYSTDVLTNRSVEYIRKAHKGKKPFFLYMTPFGTHANRQPAPRHKGMFNHAPVHLGRSFNERDMSDKPPQYKNLRKKPFSHYAHEVRRSLETAQSLDDSVKRMYGTLRKTGELKNTVFIFMSDQGYSFGQHRWDGKMSPYEESVRAPMIIAGPGIRNRHVKDVISNADLAPTIADLAGARTPKNLDGRSVLPALLHDKSLGNRAVLIHQAGGSAKRPWGAPTNGVAGFWGLRTERFKYIETENADGSTFYELYDLKRDPHEMQSVVRSPHYQRVKRQMAHELHRQKSRMPNRIPN